MFLVDSIQSVLWIYTLSMYLLLLEQSNWVVETVLSCTLQRRCSMQYTRFQFSSNGNLDDNLRIRRVSGRWIHLPTHHSGAHRAPPTSHGAGGRGSSQSVSRQKSYIYSTSPSSFLDQERERESASFLEQEREREREMGDTSESSNLEDPYGLVKIIRSASEMGATSESSNLEDPYDLLKNIRSIPIPSLPPQAEVQQPYYVLSKDISLNPSNNTWIRIFRPQILTPMAPLPIIIYFHGGGFVIASAASALFHVACEHIASLVPAIVLSVEYRLAPEHPLPAAYDDAIEAVCWVRDQAISDLHRDTWMVPDLADFSRCFLTGSSAGSNIVYHVALRALDLDPPFKIAGAIVNQPFFGGVQRTESELRLAQDRVLPLHSNDLMWRLSLPAGADRDHEFCNPMTPGSYHDRVGSLPPCLVKGYGGDPLVDRQRAFVKMLEDRGVRAVGQFDEEGSHGVEFFDPKKAQDLFTDIRDFISSVSSGL